MKIAKKYSHLNGEEYLIVHHKKLYKEIIEVIKNIDADNFRTKKSKERRKIGEKLFSPVELNKAFHKEFYQRKWTESR
ncbi:MAG: restriction endonuclease, partial [Chlorobi bacterium]|nr:restriction endonuclease [Chlorobiota bacterium]